MPQEFDLALKHGERIHSELQALGYRYIAMDLQGFRSGSLNESLVQFVQPVKRGTQSLIANHIPAVQLQDDS